MTAPSYRQETETHRFVVEYAAVHAMDRKTNQAETHQINDLRLGQEMTRRQWLSSEDFESLWSRAGDFTGTKVERVISGGQTGADRGGLDAAIALQIEHGGWCPRGRKSEDGPIPTHYALLETKSPSFVTRTKRNAEAADATLVFVDGGMSGGSLMTVEHLRELGRPHLVLILSQWAGDQSAHMIAASRVRNWLWVGGFKILNVAGSRESKAPGLQARVRDFMIEVLGHR